MEIRTIVLCYRKLIDVNAQGNWEQLVFNDSFMEFKMQFQNFNQQGKYQTFADLVHEQPIIASKLHFLISGAIKGYLLQLNHTIPDLINNIGKHFLGFENFQFEIINSDLTDKTKHQVAINFYSYPMNWLETIGEYMLLVKPEQEENNTHLFKIVPYVNIYSVK